ncbi:MAG: ThuA domain-containing protein [Janthinobacterium lividum]
MNNYPTDPIRVTVWGENRHEKLEPEVAQRYPDGMHGAIAQGIEVNLGAGVVVRTATLDDPEHGLSEEVLRETDVLTWWGHAAHAEVSDEVVDRVHRHVLAGMGLIVLHSGHWSKIFGKLMGTSCTLRWRSAHDRELVWTVDPTHPIAQGIPHPMIIEEDEMYGEFFDIPAPDELVFISSYSGGEVFRSGCTFKRGHGKIFYFKPGDQDYPVYFHEGVRMVISNAVRWALTVRPERTEPVLLRYETEDFYTGHGYGGALSVEAQQAGAQQAGTQQVASPQVREHGAAESETAE